MGNGFSTIRFVKTDENWKVMMLFLFGIKTNNLEGLMTPDIIHSQIRRPSGEVNMYICFLVRCF